MTIRTTGLEPRRPFYERAIRFVVVGTFTLLLVYVKVLASVLKFGIAAVKKIPGGGQTRE